MWITARVVWEKNAQAACRAKAARPVRGAGWSWTRPERSAGPKLGRNVAKSLLWAVSNTRNEYFYKGAWWSFAHDNKARLQGMARQAAQRRNRQQPYIAAPFRVHATRALRQLELDRPSPSPRGRQWRPHALSTYLYAHMLHTEDAHQA